jgi:hypothetical protein
MIKFAGAEDSGITDPVTGKRIHVTTTARKTFRAANAAWAKVRNVLLNTAIANDFSRAKPQTRLFKVRKDPNAVGQVRDTSNGRYIAVVGSNDIKIVSVAGGVPALRGIAPTTPAVMPGKVAPAPVALSESQFRSFLIKHASESLSQKFKIEGNQAESLLNLLSERTGLSVGEILKSLYEHPDQKAIYDSIGLIFDGMAAYDHIAETEDKNSFITDPVREGHIDLPTSAFSLSVGLQ